MRRSKAIALALGVTLLLAACGGKGDFYDELAVEGLLSGRSAEDIATLEAQTVEDGMLQVSINANPVFLNGASEGNLRIENAPGNPYDMRVTITLDEGGTLVYASGGIRPNHHIENAPLSVDLDAGEYLATAKFYAVDENHKDLGVVRQQITLTILE